MITEKLADFVTSTSYDELPDEVIVKAKLCFIDFLGVALRGSKTKSGTIATLVIDGDGESTVIGQKKARALDAGFLNGIFAHSLDLDDGHRMAQLHPGACVIPAALALAEANNQKGAEFISSVVVGYEVLISLGMMVNPEHRDRGFHSTGTCGVFGAAAAACKALDLEGGKILNALGLAGTQACGLLESDHAGTMGKHIHTGCAARSGILSALLAKGGFTGAATIIDGQKGFLSTMVNPDLLDMRSTFIDKAGIGNFHIRDVYFKEYPVCRHLHSAVEATLDILKQMNVKYLKNDDVQKIVVKTYKIAAEHNEYDPTTIEVVKQSLPLSLAITISRGRLGLDGFKIDEKIMKISNKVVIEFDEELDAIYPNMRASDVKLYTGNDSYQKRIDLPRGEPENPFNKAEIIEKFANLNPEVDMDVLGMINDLESFKMRDVMATLNQEFIKTKK